MKNLFRFGPLLLLILFLFSTCDPSTEPCIDPTVDLVEPSSNPTGYEIKLTGTGFTNTTVVRFDNSESSNTKFIDESTLIATIPAGVLSSVEISAANGDCIARNANFEVYADFPSNIPISPSSIIIPQAAISYPADFQNCWGNVLESDHCIQLNPDLDLNDGTLDKSSFESHQDKNSFFNGNPITGYFRFDKGAATSDIRIEIDRSQRPGGELEVYDGTLIDPASVGSNVKYILLLTSQKDGRQLMFLRDF